MDYGTARGFFTVVAPTPTPVPESTLAPATGNSKNAMKLMTLMISSFLGMSAILIMKKKKVTIKNKSSTY